MNKSLTTAVDTVLIGLSTSFGLAEIESILGIAILCFNIIWVVAKLVVKIYEKIKSKDYNGIVDDINKTKEELEEIHKNVEGEKEKK